MGQNPGQSFGRQARLEPDKTWKFVLNSPNNCQEQCLGVASVIALACSPIDGQDLGTTSIQGYVQCSWR